VKYQREVDYTSVNGLIQYARTYRSDVKRGFERDMPRFLDYSGTAGQRLPGCLIGKAQTHEQDVQGNYVVEPYCFPYVSVGIQSYQWSDGEGRQVGFIKQGDNYVTGDNQKVRAFRLEASGNWVLVQEDNSYAVFAPGGRLLSEHRVGGGWLNYTYTEATPPRPTGPESILLTDAFGRTARINYTSAGYVDSFQDPAGNWLRYRYDSGGACSRSGCPHLLSVVYADGTSKTYHWNEPGLALNAATIGDALTGVSDELGVRVGWYGYDADGKAVSTDRGNGIDRYRITNVDGYGVSVEDPLGGSYRFGYTSIMGSLKSTGITQPAGAGAPAASTSRSFDSIGNLIQSTGLDGKRTCYAYEAVRKLATVKVEGLPGSSCDQMVAANATLLTGSRKVSTQWHPDWRLETQVAEPGRITTIIYNGQPDPFNGNAVASCAPADALLPDGKPIAVICKRVEQATTDSNGSLGFAATLQAGVPNRVTSWTYNQHGQVLTERDPLNRQTTYAYYSDTAFTGSDPYAVGHTLGDLQSITNAKGQVTQYTQYDKHGNVLQSVDPNGVVTQNTYDLRQRLLSSTTAGQTTSYQYDAVGQLKRITLPDQSWVGYDYDGAHRQTAVYDHKGNRIEYQLDNAGNRIGEQTKDPSGALKRQLNRSIDALGRVQQTTGRE
jgi:YD repeat-containing protein